MRFSKTRIAMKLKHALIIAAAILLGIPGQAHV